MDAPVIGVILAGGRSRRMGRDKATLPFGAGRLVDHAAVRLRGALAGMPAARVLVSGRVDGFECVEDLEPALGPMGGIASVLDRLTKEPGRESAILVVPVDMPGLTARTLADLISAWREGSAAAVAYRSQELPLVVEVSRASLEAARAAVEEREVSGSRSIRAFLRRLGARWIEETRVPEAELLNANTPWDLARALP